MEHVLAMANLELKPSLFAPALISNGNIKHPIGIRGKSIFAVHLPLKIFPATVANADIKV